MTGPAGVALRLPGALRELAGGRREVIVAVPPGCAVGEVFDALRLTLPALERRIRDERGELRRHVNVFVGSDNVRDLAMLATPVPPGVEVHVIPAVSGGA
jgi:sulfur-carrier protein